MTSFGGLLRCNRIYGSRLADLSDVFMSCGEPIGHSAPMPLPSLRLPAQDGSYRADSFRHLGRFWNVYEGSLFRPPGRFLSPEITDVGRRASPSFVAANCVLLLCRGAPLSSRGPFGSPHSGAVLLVGARMNVFPVWTSHLAKG